MVGPYIRLSNICTQTIPRPAGNWISLSTPLRVIIILFKTRKINVRVKKNYEAEWCTCFVSNLWFSYFHSRATIHGPCSGGRLKQVIGYIGPVSYTHLLMWLTSVCVTHNWNIAINKVCFINLYLLLLLNVNYFFIIIVSNYERIFSLIFNSYGLFIFYCRNVRIRIVNSFY